MLEKQAPNMSADIEAIRGNYLQAWEKCLRPGDDGEFCRIIVTEMNKRNPRFGLNAKRGGPSHDTNKDVIAYYRGPTDKHVECYDFIIGHEAGGAHIGWGDTTNYQTMGNDRTARFVHPVTGGGYDGPPVDGSQPPNPPIPPSGMITLDAAVNRLRAEVKHSLTDVDLQNIAGRARVLGWDGGLLIASSIIDQLVRELNVVTTVSTITCKVVEVNQLVPIGTTIKIQIG